MTRPRSALKSNVAQFIGGAALLVAFDLTGRWLVSALELPFPGPVVGMLLLLFGLMLYGGMPEGLARVSGKLLGILVLIFMPPAVGVFYLRELTLQDWLALAAAVFIGTLISLLVTALLLRKLMATKSGQSERKQ